MLEPCVVSMGSEDIWRKLFRIFVVIACRRRALVTQILITNTIPLQQFLQRPRLRLAAQADHHSRQLHWDQHT